MEEKNSTRSFMTSDYGDGKMDKSVELNETMTIKETSADEYTNTIRNLGGSN